MDVARMWYEVWCQLGMAHSDSVRLTRPQPCSRYATSIAANGACIDKPRPCKHLRRWQKMGESMTTEPKVAGSSPARCT